MFWLRNKKTIFSLHTFSERPDNGTNRDICAGIKPLMDPTKRNGIHLLPAKMRLQDEIWYVINTCFMS